MTKRRKAITPMQVVEGPLPRALAAMLTAPDQETALAFAGQIAAAMPRLQAPSAEFWQALRYEAWQADEDIEVVKVRLRAHAVYNTLAEFIQKFTASADDETVDTLLPGFKRSKQLREKFGLSLDGGWSASDDQVRGLGAFADELRPHCTPKQAELLDLLSNGLTIADAARVMRIEPVTGRAHYHQLRIKLQAVAMRTPLNALNGSANTGSTESRGGHRDERGRVRRAITTKGEVKP